MGFLSVVHSDTGIHKDMNQDAVLIKEAETDYGKVMLAVVCDGMGGLSRGEVASAALIRAFSDWFETRFPDLLYTRRTEEGIERSRLELELDGLVQDMNGKIQEYSRKFHGKMGTTAALLLMAEGNYYTMNVGDSRVYRITSDTVSRLTTDQTVVQKEIEQGRLSREEALNHPQRNVLLQCVGASKNVVPEFTFGAYAKGEIYMLCSDGFRHLLTEAEMLQTMSPSVLKTERQMYEAAVSCTELNKMRQERDNISIILLKIC